MEENNKLEFPGVWRVFVKEVYFDCETSLFDGYIVRIKDLGGRKIGNILGGI